MPLLTLDNDILLIIFCQFDRFETAARLAQTCHSCNALWNEHKRTICQQILPRHWRIAGWAASCDIQLFETAMDFARARLRAAGGDTAGGQLISLSDDDDVGAVLIEDADIPLLANRAVKNAHFVNQIAGRVHDSLKRCHDIRRQRFGTLPQCSVPSSICCDPVALECYDSYGKALLAKGLYTVWRQILEGTCKLLSQTTVEWDNPAASPLLGIIVGTKLPQEEHGLFPCQQLYELCDASLEEDYEETLLHDLLKAGKTAWTRPSKSERQ
jgi:hypothetical protein